MVSGLCGLTTEDVLFGLGLVPEFCAAHALFFSLPLSLCLSLPRSVLLSVPRPAFIPGKADMGGATNCTCADMWLHRC